MLTGIIDVEDHKYFIGENGNKIVGVESSYKEVMHRVGEGILMNNRVDTIGKGGG